MSEMNVSKIVISFNDYRDMNVVYMKVGEIIRTLLESGYIILAYNYGGNKDFVAIEYTTNTPENVKPYWLSEEEAIEVETCRQEDCNESYTKPIKKYDDDKGGGYDA